MKKKRKIAVVIAVLLLLAALPAVLFDHIHTVLFDLSFTRDLYACYVCKSLGKSKALRVSRVPVWKQRIRVTYTLTGKQCDHEWRWYFASSMGIFFNREDWDGPIRDCPLLVEIDAAVAEGKQVEVTHQ